jgi:acetyl esterase/lipase
LDAFPKESLIVMLKPATLILLMALTGSALAEDGKQPVIERCECQGANIALRVFAPNNDNGTDKGAIVLFHGGGWNDGDASWMDPTAGMFAGLGLVAISVDYRLTGGAITPFDAVQDARNAIRWVRTQSKRLGVNPGKIAALGTSAGAHLAAATAIFDEPWGSDVSASPNFLILRSPAISVADSSWFKKISGGAAQAAALSPSLHIRANLPPMLLLQGAEDNMTPAAESQLFCQRMQKVGNECELKLYPGVGHLFTRNLANQEIPDYNAIDASVSKKATEASIAFLEKHGFGLVSNAP